jgi:Flp pilus assembly protein TadG
MRDLMFRLCRPMVRLLGRDERGGIAVIVAVLIGAGVLLGMAALTVDVGRIYQNRAELQNGADAGALAVAKSCVSGNCTLAAATQAATQYATANASTLTSGDAAVDLVCGSGGLGACPGSSGAKTDCPAAPPANTNYVDVHTSTLTPGGATLPRIFAGVGAHVKACAQAEWGAPKTAQTVAFTISACEWDQATAQGVSFAPPPPYPPNPLPAPSFDQVLKLHTTTTSGSCPSEPAGADGPGAFGWTDDQTGTCLVDITNNTYSVNTGVSAGQTCQQALAAAQASRSLVFIPIYTSITGTGTGAVYTLKGFAAFVVTGYHLPGFVASDWLNPANDCKGSDKCINGYFTQGLIPSTGDVGGSDLGARIVKLTG